MNKTFLAFLISERHLLEGLRRQGALSREAARPLPELRAGQGAQVRYLTRAGVLREGDRGGYYVDESRLAELGASRRRGGLIAIGVLLAGALVWLGARVL